MYKAAARTGTILHDLFVFAALAYTVASFFLRSQRPYAERSTLWVVIFLLWLAFCAWSAWKALSALVRGGGQRTANFEAMLERRAQAGSGSPLPGFFTFTVVTGAIRLVIPTVLWLI